MKILADESIFTHDEVSLGSGVRVIGQDKQRHFTPHLTLTMRLDARKTEALLQQLRQTDWHTRRWNVPIAHLWLMQRGPADLAWRYIHRIEMTSPASLSSQPPAVD
jgi:hypothetical protein